MISILCLGLHFEQRLRGLPEPKDEEAIVEDTKELKGITAYYAPPLSSSPLPLALRLALPSHCPWESVSCGSFCVSSMLKSILHCSFGNHAIGQAELQKGGDFEDS